MNKISENSKGNEMRLKNLTDGNLSLKETVLKRQGRRY